MKKNKISIQTFTDEQIAPWIPHIAKLRIEVFAEFPFLYAGDFEYEMRYLKKFMAMQNAIMVAAFDGDQIVGISTGYPLAYEMEAFQQLIQKSGFNPDEFFCYGESVLRKSYRGLGIGKQFFQKREAHVRSHPEYCAISFYTSLRSTDDPRCPTDYRPLAPFWQKLGFVQYPELTAEVSYQEIGEESESLKKMILWIKKLTPENALCEYDNREFSHSSHNSADDTPQLDRSGSQA